MNLINMERPKPEDAKKEAVEAMPITGNSYYEKYPWGLRLTLNNEELKKLGMKIKDLEIDTVVSITAKALITSLSSDQNIENKEGTRNRVELQITDLAVESAEDFEGAFKEAVDE
jgi:hypothetical protein